MSEPCPLPNLPNKPRKLSDSFTQKDKSLLLQKRKHNALVQGCDSIQNYTHLNKIHEGVYGIVFRAKDSLTDEIFAIKKVKLPPDQERGFPVTSIREINLVMGLRHENIIGMREIVTGDHLDKIYLVMEYCEHELRDLLEQTRYVFREPEIKQILLQLLRGLDYLHQRQIAHRDLKPSNLLYSNTGRLKICDFGLARRLASGPRQYTPVVVTLWYRAIEVLLGNDQYSCAIDVWSVGCIFAELVNRKPLLMGKNEAEQIELILRMFGTPTDETWPGWRSFRYSNAISYQKYPPTKFADHIAKGVVSDCGIRLMREML